MTIKPVGKKLKLRIEPIKVGNIQTDTIAERGVVVDIGADVERGPIGSIIYFKAWAVDVITTADGEKHYFIDSDSTAICGYETN